MGPACRRCLLACILLLLSCGLFLVSLVGGVFCGGLGLGGGGIGNGGTASGGFLAPGDLGDKGVEGAEEEEEEEEVPAPLRVSAKIRCDLLFPRRAAALRVFFCCCVICFFARNPKADCITIGLLLRTVLLLIGSCCRILSMLFDIAHPTGRLERRPERAKWASGLDIRGRAVSRGDIEPILPMGVLTFDREVEVMEERESLERRGEGGVEVSEVLRGEDT